MITRRLAGSVLGALSCLLLAAGPAQATGGTGGSVVSVAHTGEFGVSDSALTITFDRTLDSAKLAQVKDSLAGQLVAAPQTARPHGALPLVAGPQGAYLYCDDPYSFGDTDGTFTFSHVCGATTSPWSYRQTSGLCSIVAGDVDEGGLTWTRNGTKMPKQAPHVEGCGYVFHGTFNPDHDYDFLTYSDTLVFDVDVDGNIGSAVLNITGSFTSAGCANGHACGQ